jgi:DNA-binding NarL/FixJ family response regulator
LSPSPEKKEPPVRVLIADDHPYSRNGLRALLGTSPLVQVIGEARDGREALRLVEESHPEVVLMDVQMPVMDGLEATRYLKRHWPEIKVIMLTVYENRQTEALAAGADYFLVKGCPVEQMWSTRLKPKGKKPPYSSIRERH